MKLLYIYKKIIIVLLILLLKSLNLFSQSANLVAGGSMINFNISTFPEFQNGKNDNTKIVVRVSFVLPPKKLDVYAYLKNQFFDGPSNQMNASLINIDNCKIGKGSQSNTTPDGSWSNYTIPSNSSLSSNRKLIATFNYNDTNVSNTDNDYYIIFNLSCVPTDDNRLLDLPEGFYLNELWFGFDYQE